MNIILEKNPKEFYSELFRSNFVELINEYEKNTLQKSRYAGELGKKTIETDETIF